mgnify:CR=1 FL=1|jgi:hypothetical protein
MTFKIEHRDLFSVPKDYSLVHCISADFVLGAGIAKEFNKRGVKNELLRRYGDYANSSVWIGKALETHATDWNWEYNLVTKGHYWGKPNYVTLEMCLKNLRDVYVNHNEHLAPKLAMPWLGCGLDKLERWKVEVLIKDVFKNCDVEILICDWG